MTKRIELQVIRPPEEGTRVVFASRDKDLLVKGMELETYICGNCGFVLAENIFPNNYDNILFVCPDCKSYNEVAKT